AGRPFGGTLPKMSSPQSNTRLPFPRNEPLLFHFLRVPAGTRQNLKLLHLRTVTGSLKLRPTQQTDLMFVCFDRPGGFFVVRVFLLTTAFPRFAQQV
ncbi:MAG: hypothetical protein PHY64_04385, partial [Eubacteriales bacterium]|nr:hypothetical protein [Eubacteriales bacterium]